jgi:hypothetical protein
MVKVKLNKRWIWSEGHTEVPIEGQKHLSWPLKGCN